MYCISMFFAKDDTVSVCSKDKSLDLFHITAIGTDINGLGHLINVSKWIIFSVSNELDFLALLKQGYCFACCCTYRLLLDGPYT